MNQLPATIRAARVHAFGGPENLVVEEIPSPQAGPGEVLVRVAYAGLNPLDYKMRDGSSGLAAKLDLPAVLGREVAGTVIGAADDVDLDALGMPLGAPVFGMRAMDDLRGAYAEVVAIRASDLAPLPASAREDDLAAWSGLALTGLTALAAIRAADVSPGQTVLIHGGSGGVGQMLIPLLVRAGAGRVWATGRSENAARIARLGATPIPYDASDWEAVIDEATGGRGVDAVIDAHYFSTFLPSLEHLAAGGRIVALPSLADLTPARERGFAAHIPQIAPVREDLDHLAAEHAAGRLPVEVSGVLPLTEAPRGHEQLASGHTRGKIVLAL